MANNENWRSSSGRNTRGTGSSSGSGRGRGRGRSSGSGRGSDGRGGSGGATWSPSEKEKKSSGASGYYDPPSPPHPQQVPPPYTVYDPLRRIMEEELVASTIVTDATPSAPYRHALAMTAEDETLQGANPEDTVRKATRAWKKSMGEVLTALQQAQRVALAFVVDNR